MAEMQTAEPRDVSTRRQSSPATTDEARQARILTPPVDIFEKDDALVIVADMPGVSSDSLNVEVGNRVLTLEGTIDVQMSEGVSPTFAEVRGSRYRRRFTIGDSIDTDNVKGTIRDGVLTVELPKQAPLRRRRIEVKTA